MPREIVDFEHITVEALAELRPTTPARLVLPNPQRGGLRISAIRSALAHVGRVRISGTTARVFVDIDPGDPEPPLIALDTIVRSDAVGLERMLLSVLPHVDEIVLGVDGRSDNETLRVALAYADCAFVFEAADIGMTREAWEPSEGNPRGRIDFAAARNLGRARVHAPWALVIDSDEFLASAEDLRAKVKEAPDDVDSFMIRVQMGSFEHPDPQRLVRTKYRWLFGTHNQIIYPNEPRGTGTGTLIVCDTSLRDMHEQEKRLAQRDAGIEELQDEIAKGNVLALFHLAKHRAGRAADIADAVKLVEDFRLRTEPHGPLADERVWAAMSLAFRYYNEGNLPEAERWAVRALLDGPSMTAFCVLGDVAEGQGDLEQARTWYECACVTNARRVEWPGYTELRFGRLSGIKIALANPEAAQKVEVVDEVEATGSEAEPSTRT